MTQFKENEVVFEIQMTQFNENEVVFDLREGFGEVTSVVGERITVKFPRGQVVLGYELDGRQFKSDFAPVLMTKAAALLLGHMPPKKKVMKKISRWACYSEYVSMLVYDTKEEAISKWPEFWKDKPVTIVELSGEIEVWE